METIISILNDYFKWFTLSVFKVTDIFEILILAFIIYHIIKWICIFRAVYNDERNRRRRCEIYVGIGTSFGS